MESATMGRVIVEVTVENLQDVWDVKRGLRQADLVRRLTIRDALVDTAATTLSLPTQLIQQLGLAKQTQKRVMTSVGPADAAMYDAVRLTIQDRFCTLDVMEVPDGVSVLIGQIPLEMLDLVVDPRSQRLIGNPAHGGEHIIELL